MNDDVIYTVKPVLKGHLNVQEKVVLHDRYPFISGSLKWGRYDIILRTCVPLDHKMSSHGSIH